MMANSALLDRYKVMHQPLRTERRLELAAVILGLLLCLQLLYGGVRLVLLSAPEAIAPALDVLQLHPLQVQARVSASESNEIQARPLFWLERRPLESVVEVMPEPVITKQGVGKLKDVKLLGVFGAGDAMGIIAQNKKQRLRVLQGETIAGWSLELVESNRAVFVANGRREELVLLPRQVVMADKPSLESTVGKPEAIPGPGVKGTGTSGMKGNNAPAIPYTELRRGVRRAPAKAKGKQ